MILKKTKRSQRILFLLYIIINKYMIEEKNKSKLISIYNENIDELIVIDCEYNGFMLFNII